MFFRKHRQISKKTSASFLKNITTFALLNQYIKFPFSQLSNQIHFSVFLKSDL